MSSYDEEVMKSDDLETSARSDSYYQYSDNCRVKDTMSNSSIDPFPPLHANYYTTSRSTMRQVHQRNVSRTLFNPDDVADLQSYQSLGHQCGGNPQDQPDRYLQRNAIKTKNPKMIGLCIETEELEASAEEQSLRHFRNRKSPQVIMDAGSDTSGAQINHQQKTFVGVQFPTPKQLNVENDWLAESLR